MARIDLALPDDLKAFVEAEARAGGYENSGAYVQNVLRNLWRQKAKAALEAKLIASAESEPAIEPTPVFWTDLKARVRARTAGNGDSAPNGPSDNQL